MTKQEFLERAREKHGYKYEYPSLTNKVKSTDTIDILYDGVIYKQRVIKHITLGRCPEKNTPKKTTEQFIEEAKKVWGDKYDYSLFEYNGALKKVKIIYEGIIFEQEAVSHLQGIKVEKTLTLDNFIRKAKIVHGDKYDYSQIKSMENGSIPVTIGYNGIYYTQRPYDHLSGKRPENRVLSVRKTIKKFIDDANLVHDYKYSYDKAIYVTNRVKLIITCPIHGDFEQIPNSHLGGSGCPTCKDSIGEKEIAKFLKEHDINYDRQHKFTDCKNQNPLPFDFYIPSFRMCIEFDDIQHFEPVKYFGGIDRFNQIKINDSIKNEYCEDNYINLIRIRYDDDIYRVLWDNLSFHIKRLKNNI